MHLFPVLVLLTKLSFLISAAPPPRSELARNPFLSLNAARNGSLLNLPVEMLPPLSPELNTTESVKIFHVPNTYISLLWVSHAKKPIEFKLLRDMIDDAIDQVTDNIEAFGDTVLPDDRDPYVDGKYAGEAPKGGYIWMQSPEDGPAYGRKLTWGNVRDALSGLREIMVKKGRPYETSFDIRHDVVGIIGRGGVIPGKPDSILHLEMYA